VQNQNSQLVRKCDDLCKEIDILKDTVELMQEIDTSIINQDIENKSQDSIPKARRQQINQEMGQMEQRINELQQSLGKRVEEVERAKDQRDRFEMKYMECQNKMRMQESRLQKLDKEMKDVSLKFEEIHSKRKDDRQYIEDLEGENDHLKFLNDTLRQQMTQITEEN
jgi:chromosome segregation ATPase